MENAPGTLHDLNPSMHPIDQLRVVTDEVEAFLANWIQRVEQLNAWSCNPDTQPRKDGANLEQERLQWDAKRNHEMKELHEKAEQLADAWLRLEQEQRRLLQMRDSQPLLHRSLASEPTSGRSPNDERNAESKPTTESSARDAAHGEAGPMIRRRPGPTACNPARASAIQQFEQLRREIQSSRQSNG